MNWKTAIIGSVLGAAALRLLLIPNIWIVLGFVALVLFWIFFAGQVQDARKKKWVNLGFGVLLGLALITTVGLNVYNSHVKPYTKMSSAATERAKLAADMELALRVNPNMLKSRMELTNQIQWLQDKIGERDAAELDGVKQAFLAREITAEEAWKITFKILEGENSNRQKNKEAASMLSAVSLNPASHQFQFDLKKIGWPVTFLIFIGGIILIALVMRLFKGVMGGTVTTVVAIGLFIVLIFMAWPGLSGKMEGFATETNKSNSQSNQKNGCVIGKYQFTVRAGCPSKDVYAPPDSPNGTISIYNGPSGTQIVTQDGSPIGPLARTYGVRDDFKQGIRFLSPVDGVVEVTLLKK